ncbi:MAG TPA: methylthioribulose 1-phosphate dehydratase [Blastocatellia bacterium]|nr:methylthioribulose 1-phosphate dehydratase [Blastocatellia bacterium]
MNSSGKEEDRKFVALAEQIARLSQDFYRRGWVLGTSGNFSAVLTHDPLRLAITSSGRDKGALTPAEVLRIDADGDVISGAGRPSAETLLHLAIVRARGANAVLHTHSVWGTIVSEVYAGEGGVGIAGYEMLKGLDGVRSHRHSEWLPIIENSQDYPALAQTVEEILERHPGSHGFLLRGHGLYTWGKDLDDAKRHIEILEFLLEVMGRAGQRS